VRRRFDHFGLTFCRSGWRRTRRWSRRCSPRSTPSPQRPAPRPPPAPSLSQRDATPLGGTKRVLRSCCIDSAGGAGRGRWTRLCGATRTSSSSKRTSARTGSSSRLATTARHGGGGGPYRIYIVKYRASGARRRKNRFINQQLIRLSTPPRRGRFKHGTHRDPSTHPHTCSRAQARAHTRAHGAGLTASWAWESPGTWRAA